MIPNLQYLVTGASIAELQPKLDQLMPQAAPPLADRLEKSYRVYTERHGPTPTGLPEVYADLRSELELHMFKGKRILFPAIAVFEAAAADGMPPPRTPFGPLSNPIGMIESEHDSAGQSRARICEITVNFALPDYPCVTHRTLIGGLHELEQDLHRPIYLEDNILSPQAMDSIAHGAKA